MTEADVLDLALARSLWPVLVAPSGGGAGLGWGRTAGRARSVNRLVRA